MSGQETGGQELRERIAEAFLHEAGDPRPGDSTPGEIADLVLGIVQPEMERFRKAVEDAPAVATWTGSCVECGDPIKAGDRITWRLRWSPQGPIHEECR